MAFFFLLKGFETRGTEISRRLTAWENLLDSVSHVGPLTTNPLEAQAMLAQSPEAVEVRGREKQQDQRAAKHEEGRHRRRRRSEEGGRMRRKVLSPSDEVNKEQSAKSGTCFSIFNVYGEGMTV